MKLGEKKMAKKKKVLLIGWDAAADWKVMHPLIDAGKMPTLKKFINEGVMGNLATLDPPLSPIMWTSIGTGKTADKHGVMGFTQPREDGSGIQPVLSTSRKVKAVWNILMQEGYKSHVIGWWPSHPADPINGVCISNFYHHATGALDDEWKMAPGTVHPPELADILAELRVHPDELTASHIAPFVPDLEKIDQTKDQRLRSVAKITAEASSMHAAATWIMENQAWDFLAVYYDAIDHYCHGFMKFHPPYREGIPRDLYDLYHEVVESGYRFHDMMLERLLQLAGDDTTVIMCSDHGFHPDHLRPLQLPKEPAGPAAEHSPYGMIAMRGPNIKQDQLIYGSTLLDITPTVLTLFDLPTARDMDGRPLLQAFKQAPELKVIDSWEDVVGDCGMHAVDAKQDPWMEQEALDQLVALGYIEPPGDNVQKTVENNARESKYYLARVYLSKNDYADALPLLEELFAKYPDQSRFGLRLANVYLNLERIAEARRVTDETIAVSEQTQVQEIKDNFAQQKAAKEKAEKEKADEEKTDEVTEESQKIPELPDDATLLEQIRQRNRPTLELLQGNLCLAEENPEQALEHFQKAQTASPRLPDLQSSIGHSYLKMQQLQDAEEAFFQGLEINPDSAAALYGLGLVYLQMRQFTDAAETLMDSVGRIYHNPNAHYFLGEAFYRLGRFEMAAQSWEVAVTQAPGLKKAHKRLVDLYQRHLNEAMKAAQHQQMINKIVEIPTHTSDQAVDTALESVPTKQRIAPKKLIGIKPEKIITIVSGLPRSGTSMMMQILQAGGMDLLTDAKRVADDNPKGYFELEAIKNLGKDIELFSFGSR
jgi:predicted AlkP superfamily phosphohydrolase/phosphomutase/tetratricopeptide (TPR) repeat protein